MYKTIDLFAGAGGLSYGFEMTGEFEIVAAAENNKNAKETFRANHKNNEGLVLIDDVRDCDFEALSDRLGGIDVVIGGPPCQGFSNANRQKNHIISMNNSLVKEYFRAVKEIKPKAFVMENVAMLASNTHRFYDSYRDHDEVVQLDIKMDVEELVLAEEDFNGHNILEILQNEAEAEYRISGELFQLLNVLFKNRNNNNKLEKFIGKNRTKLLSELNQQENYNTARYDILQHIHHALFENPFVCDFNRLGDFIKFQKAFRLKQELDDNEIIYELDRNIMTGKVFAIVNSYSVVDYVDKILEDEYEKNSAVVNSLWFGVPQERRRFILFGIRKELLKNKTVEMPNSPAKEEIVTVGDAILDLASYETSEVIIDGVREAYKENEELSEYAKLMRLDSEGVSNHIITKSRDKAKARFKVLKEGENFHKLSSEMKDNYADPSRTQNSIYLRLDSSKPSGTVINVRKSMWIHPVLDRAISIREAARLQSFPDKFIFKGTKDSQYQQIGNAVPPLMAKGIAERLIENIKQ